MDRKRCFKCLETKSLSDFYKHPQMADGHLNKCKSCTKSDSAKQLEKSKLNPEWVVNNRQRNREAMRERKKLGLPKYNTPKFCPPHKKNAIKKVLRALISGKLTKKNCECCGSPNTQGHHEDYSKPLDVIWLCPRHHSDRHIYLRNCKTLGIEPLPFDPKTAIAF